MAAWRLRLRIKFWSMASPGDAFGELRKSPTFARRIGYDICRESASREPAVRFRIQDRD